VFIITGIEKVQEKRFVSPGKSVFFVGKSVGALSNMPWTMCFLSAASYVHSVYDDCMIFGSSSASNGVFYTSKFHICLILQHTCNIQLAALISFHVEGAHTCMIKPNKTS